MNKVKVALILALLIVPIIGFLKLNAIITFLDVDEKQFLELFKLIIPLNFSIVILIINTIISGHKDKIEIRNGMVIKYNKEISNYNSAILSLKKNYHLTLVGFMHFHYIFEHFKNVALLDQLPSGWNEIAKSKGDVSNDPDFREKVRDISNEMFRFHKSNGVCDNIFEYISSSKLKNVKIKLLDENKEIFMTNFASDVIVNGRAKSIIHLASEIASAGSDSYWSLESYNDKIDQFRHDFVINNEKTNVSLSSAIYDMFFMYEVFIFELFIYENAILILSDEFTKYVNNLEVLYPELDRAIKIVELETPVELADKYDLKIVSDRYAL
ncbi:hypothetical protein PVK62_16430 [Aliivibrio sp. S3MY1]|uniref:hypothetical protein n=1 Tax=unclassified Aliivibrio TaxID=2645654 RepID=UPI0023795ADD|nr:MULTISPECIES: hypothetical protein [unclassified Aliivibrio]MDD9197416.1 hypothetical protein [Aliivibrio sp. S3MY1]MDD9200739.1 hypothetical protein [Aliivibrio sp. S2MY1]